MIVKSAPKAHTPLKLNRVLNDFYEEHFIVLYFSATKKVWANNKAQKEKNALLVLLTDKFNYLIAR